MDSLKVPYGLNTAGELVSILNAVKGESYNCPACRLQLIHKDGPLRTAHFAHQPSASCSLESILHKTAKKLVADAIHNNAVNNQSIQLISACRCCTSEVMKTLKPTTFTSAREEVNVADYVCDVVGFRGENIALAVEICNTHKVDAEKGAQLPVHWIELNAEDVIKSPNTWRPTQYRLKQVFCPECKDDTNRIYASADKWGIDRNLYTPITFKQFSAYVASTIECYKCKETVPVFWWDGVPFCEKTPPEPKPHTIKLRDSQRYGGAYWANTCPKCKALQGDNFVFLFSDAPFADMPMSENAQSGNANLKVKTGPSAVSEFVNMMTRNIGRY